MLKKLWRLKEGISHSELLKADRVFETLRFRQLYCNTDTSGREIVKELGLGNPSIFLESIPKLLRRSFMDFLDCGPSNHRTFRHFCVHKNYRAR